MQREHGLEPGSWWGRYGSRQEPWWGGGRREGVVWTGIHRFELTVIPNEP